MSRFRTLILSMLCIAFCLTPSTIAGPDSVPVPNGFNYQGKLEMDGQPFTGTIDVKFHVYNYNPSPTFTEFFTNVEVTDGLFQLYVNLGTFDIFGEELEIELEVRTPPGSGDYTTLAPRQPIRSVPYAMRATAAEISTTSRLLNLPTSLRTYDPDSVLPALSINQTMTEFGGAALRLTRGTDDNALAGYIDRVLEIESAGTLVGILATADLFPIAAVLDANTASGGAAILGQVNSDATNHTAIPAINEFNFTQALLATRDYAGFMLGELRVNGDITKSYATASYDLATPIAYGTIDLDGTILSGTPNFSCVYNTGAARYEILIDDEYYTYTDYVTTATPASRGRLMSVGSNSGRMIVDALRLSTDTYGECVFQFVTYKPGGAARVQGNPRPPLQPLTTPNDIDLRQRITPLPDRVPVQDPKATALPTTGN